MKAETLEAIKGVIVDARHGYLSPLDELTVEIVERLVPDEPDAWLVEVSSDITTINVLTGRTLRRYRSVSDVLEPDSSRRTRTSSYETLAITPNSRFRYEVSKAAVEPRIGVTQPPLYKEIWTFDVNGTEISVEARGQSLLAGDDSRFCFATSLADAIAGTQLLGEHSDTL